MILFKITVVSLNTWQGLCVLNPPLVDFVEPVTEKNQKFVENISEFFEANFGNLAIKILSANGAILPKDIVIFDLHVNCGYIGFPTIEYF